MRSVDPRSKYLPTTALECWYYAQVFYGIMGTALGLSVGSLGAAGVALLAAVCLIRAGKYFGVILQAAALPIACGLSFVAMQTLVHGDSLLGDSRPYIAWMFGLVIVHYLALRPGFLHRFAVVAAAIGLATLPFFRSLAGDQSRLALEKGVSIGNPNDLGAWFGFCCVYFAVVGLETRRNWIRALSWVAAGGCLAVIGLTVSRGSLFAVACSVLFGFRRMLGRGFAPFLALVVAAWFGYGLGFFESSATRFAQRGFEESGRLLVWPLAIARFLESPLTGVGVDQVATFVPQANKGITPHNAIIFIALAAGVVPLLFFVIDWVQLFARTFRRAAASSGEASLDGSLLLYSFLISMSLSEPFQFPWMMATLATVRVANLASSARGVAGAPTVGSPVVSHRRGGDPWSHSHLAASQGHRPSVG